MGQPDVTSGLSADHEVNRRNRENGKETDDQEEGEESGVDRMEVTLDEEEDEGERSLAALRPRGDDGSVSGRLLSSQSAGEVFSCHLCSYRSRQVPFL